MEGCRKNHRTLKELTSQMRVFLEKLIVLQLIKKFSTFNGSRNTLLCKRAPPKNVS
jgi:hypothetical protein